MGDVGGSTRKTMSNLHGSVRSRYFCSIKNYLLNVLSFARALLECLSSSALVTRMLPVCRVYG